MFKKWSHKKEKNEIVYMPIPNKIHMMGDIYFAILSYGQSQGKNKYTNYCIRELDTGDIAQLSVHVNNDKKVHYTMHYSISHSRPGFHHIDLIKGHDTYMKKEENRKFVAYDEDRRVCQYIGNNTCQDLKTKEKYTFTNPKITEELALLDDYQICTVCHFQNEVYFLASFEERRIATYYCCQGEWVHMDKLMVVKLNDNIYFKSGSVNTDGCYRVSVSEVLDTSVNHAYQQGTLPAPIYVFEKVESQYLYGYVHGINGDEKKLIFTDINTKTDYELPIESVSEDDFVLLCQDLYFAKIIACHDSKTLCMIEKIYPTSTMENLQYLHDEDGQMVFMNTETFDMIKFTHDYCHESVNEGDLVTLRYTYDEELKEINKLSSLYCIEKIIKSD